MYKKKRFIILILVVVGLGLFYKYELQAKTVISKDLSERSKEFLEKKSMGDSGVLQYANVGEERVERGGQTIKIDSCLRVRIPFPIKYVRRDGECDYTIGLTKPRGSLVIYSRQENIASEDQMPGVSMRRQSAHTYKEARVRSKIGTFITFTKTVDGYEKNALYYIGGGRYVVINLLAATGAEYEKEFESILSSIDLEK